MYAHLLKSDLSFRKTSGSLETPHSAAPSGRFSHLLQINHKLKHVIHSCVCTGGCNMRVRASLRVGNKQVLWAEDGEVTGRRDGWWVMMEGLIDVVTFCDKLWWEIIRSGGWSSCFCGLLWWPWVLNASQDTTLICWSGKCWNLIQMWANVALILNSGAYRQARATSQSIFNIGQQHVRLRPGSDYSQDDFHFILSWLTNIQRLAWLWTSGMMNGQVVWRLFNSTFFRPSISVFLHPLI